MTETLETLAAGDVVETRLGHRYRVIRIVRERLIECSSIKYPEFDPYTFPVEALQRTEAEG